MKDAKINKSFIFKSSMIIMAATLISKLLGLAREQFSLYLFGGSFSHDAFIAAFKLPNALRNLLAEGAFSAAFIPIFSSLLINKTRDEAYRFANKVISLLLIVSVVVTVLGIVFSHFIMPVIYKNGGHLSLAIQMAQIMMPFVVFISIAAILMGILNSMHTFLAPALAPLFANVAFIIIVALTYKKLGVSSLAYAVFASGILYFISQMPSAAKKKYRFRFNFQLRDDNLKRFLKSFFPIAFGMAVFQLNLLISVRFSSPFEGAVVAIDKTFIILQLILSVFVTGISTVSLPTFSRYAASKEWDHFKQTFMVGIRIVLFFTIPAMLGLMALNTDVAALIYRDIFQVIKGNAGKVLPADIINMGNCLFFFAPGMVSFGCVVILNRAFQGVKRYYVPFFTGVAAIIFNVILIKIFVNTSLNFIGIPLAISLSSILNMILLGIVLRYRMGKMPWISLIDSAAKIVFASAIMAAVIRLLKRKVLHLNFNRHTGMEHLVLTLLLIAVGIIIYAFLLYLFKEKDFLVILHKIKNKLFSGKLKETVTEEAEDYKALSSVSKIVDRESLVSDLEDTGRELEKERQSDHPVNNEKGKDCETDATFSDELSENSFIGFPNENYRAYKERKMKEENKKSPNENPGE